MSKVLLYGMNGWPVSQKAKRVLRERGVDFDEIVVDDNEELVDELERLSGQLTVPVIVWSPDNIEIGIDGEIGWYAF